MRRLALVLLVLTLPLLAWATPGGYPDRGQPLRGVPDRGQPVAPTGGAPPAPTAQRTTSALHAIGLFNLVQDIFGNALRAWGDSIDAIREWLVGLSPIVFGGVLLGIGGGVYGIRRWKRWRDGEED